MSLEIKIQTAEPAHIQIEKFVRREIQKGVLVQGQRLPSTQELTKIWGINHMAIQKAMARLEAAGLIERTQRRGTFVRSVMDKAVVGILMGDNLLDETALFYRALGNAIRAEIGSSTWSCRAYDRLNDIDQEVTMETQQHLIDDIRNYAFKGLLLISIQPGIFKEEVKRSDLPKVFFGGVPDKADVAHDDHGFTQSAVQYLVTHGRRRLIYLRTADERSPGHDVDGFMDTALALGLALTQKAILQVEGFVSRTVSAEWLGYTQMKGIMAWWDASGTWPDGLIVSDDVVMRGAAQALSEHGVKVPEKLLIVSAANEGIHHLYAVPVVRFEFSPGELARQMVALLDKKMRREPLPDLPIVVKGCLKEQDLKSAGNGAMV